MLKKTRLIAVFCVVFALPAFSQNTPADSIRIQTEQGLAIDTALDYDDILEDLGDFLDSLLAPRSYLLTSLSFANGYFNYKTKNNTDLSTRKQFVITPTIGYYHKSGPGITFSGSLVNDGDRRKLYQYSISPSFDFIQHKKLIAGISFTRYITADSLSFYTSPLQNEVTAYFLWRRSWVQPGLSANYGWGNRTDVQKRVRYIQLLKKKRLGTVITTINQIEESINDFSLTASVRHSFYWLHVSGNNSYLKFTPMIAFASGTQKFGFNQTTGISASSTRNNGSVKYNTGNVNLDDKVSFQPLSVTLYLRPEYSIGKFFLQPQFILDYYFPATSNNLTTLFSINSGFMF